jgi:hypothetical protein
LQLDDKVYKKVMSGVKEYLNGGALVEVSWWIQSTTGKYFSEKIKMSIYIRRYMSLRGEIKLLSLSPRVSKCGSDLSSIGSNLPKWSGNWSFCHLLSQMTLISC